MHHWFGLNHLIRWVHYEPLNSLKMRVRCRISIVFLSISLYCAFRDTLVVFIYLCVQNWAHLREKSIDLALLWLLLPPANEVWGKVIFLHLFVILFTGGGMHGQWGGWGMCMVGGVHAGGGACVARGVCMPCTPHAAWYHEIRSVNERAVRILLECILVRTVVPLPYEKLFVVVQIEAFVCQ